MFGSRAMAVGTVIATGILVAPTAAPAHAPVARVNGIGHFVYAEAGTDGHRIWFGVRATSRGGSFRFRHELPDGTVVGHGQARVTCLQVSGNVALIAAIAGDHDGVRNHAFYLRIVDNGQRDLISDVQAANGDEPPPTHCVDPGDFQRPVYPILAGGYVVRG